MHLFSRSQLRLRLAAAFADPDRLRTLLGLGESAGAEPPPGGDEPALPTAIVKWLRRLTRLKGVPFNYLVPDEAMLPPESIRFFYLDINWIDALVDGALSLGRNLTPSTSPSASMTLDRATRPELVAAVRAAAESPVVSGFVLRSAVVRGYPGIGVNAYPAGGTPEDATITLLPILRLDQLGPRSEVLICLIDGDAVQVDVHEPPEGLHYGFDSYSTVGGLSASKSIYTFTRDGATGSVRMSEEPTSLPDVATCFRPASPRVVMMSSLAALIASANGVQAIDSAEMGFEMTEGVGQVSFLRRGSLT